MKDLITNRLSMVGAVLAVADNHTNAWNNVAPTAFTTKLAALRAQHIAIHQLAADAYAARTGQTDAKALAETNLENAAYTMARACCAMLKDTGNLADRAKVDFAKSDITRLRGNTLITTATNIRDIAAANANGSQSADYGITAARLTALSDAISTFTNLNSAPRSEIANRSSMIREVETRVAELMSLLPDLDDLVLQFDTTPAALAFGAAWTQARIIVDAGHGPGANEPTPPTPPAPTP